MGAIDLYVVFVAEHRNREIDRLERPGIPAFLHLRLGVLHTPADVAILLPDLRRIAFSALGYPAFFDGRLLLLGVPLLRGRHDGRVDDLPAHGKVPPVGERGIKAGK